MSQVLLLDTNVWSHLLLAEPTQRARVQTRLRELAALYPGATRATSRICIAEALVGARRLADAQARRNAEAALQAEFANPNLLIVEITDKVAGSDEQVFDTAAALRGDALRTAALQGGTSAGADGGRLKLPDAIVAASCLAFSPPAVLVTENVADFRWTTPGSAGVTVAGLTVEKL